MNDVMIAPKDTDHITKTSCIPSLKNEKDIHWALHSHRPGDEIQIGVGDKTPAVQVRVISTAPSCILNPSSQETCTVEPSEIGKVPSNVTWFHDVGSASQSTPAEMKES